MTYTDTARAYVHANHNDAEAAATLPLSEWSESRRDIMTPQTVAVNHAMHVRGLAQDLRVMISANLREGTPQIAADLANAAAALLAAIGEAHA